MTLLVALRHDNHIFLGADSQTSCGGRVHSNSTQKITISDSATVVASCGMADATGFLSYILASKYNIESADLNSLFYEEIPHELSNFDNWDVDNVYLVAIKGSLWRVTITIESKKISYMATEVLDLFTTEGSGWVEANSYLNLNISKLSKGVTPRELIQSAIKFTSEHNTSVNSQSYIVVHTQDARFVEKQVWKSYELDNIRMKDGYDRRTGK